MSPEKRWSCAELINHDYFKGWSLKAKSDEPTVGTPTMKKVVSNYLYTHKFQGPKLSTIPQRKPACQAEQYTHGKRDKSKQSKSVFTLDLIQ